MIKKKPGLAVPEGFRKIFDGYVDKIIHFS